MRIHLESDKRVKPGGITFITKERALEIMRKRVIALEMGKLVRDERRGGYAEE